MASAAGSPPHRGRRDGRRCRPAPHGDRGVPLRASHEARSRPRPADTASFRSRVKDTRAALVEQVRETRLVLPAAQFALTDEESSDFAKKGSRCAYRDASDEDPAGENEADGDGGKTVEPCVAPDDADVDQEEEDETDDLRDSAAREPRRGRRRSRRHRPAANRCGLSGRRGLRRPRLARGTVRRCRGPTVHRRRRAGDSARRHGERASFEQILARAGRKSDPGHASRFDAAKRARAS